MRNTIANGGMTGRDKGIERVFAYRLGNSYSNVKAFTKPSNPKSELQNIVRNAFTLYAGGWSSLTQAQRDAWNADAPNWVNTGIFGAKKQSGQNLYIGCNVALAVAGLPDIEVPGSREMIGQIVTLGLSYSASRLKLEGVMIDARDTNAIQVAVSSPKSMGSSKSTKLTVLKSIKTTNAILLDLTSSYISKYGSIPVVGKIFYEIRYVTDGGRVAVKSSGYLDCNIY